MNPEEGGGIDWSSEMDRMLVMKMIIKMADINTPTKSLELHRKWTERITEEFYQQVDGRVVLSWGGGGGGLGEVLPCKMGGLRRVQDGGVWGGAKMGGLGGCKDGGSGCGVI